MTRGFGLEADYITDHCSHKKSRCFKITFVVLLFVFLSSRILFSETETILANKNEYGGKTVQYDYEKGDRYSSQLVSSVYYFDSEGKPQRVIHNFNQAQSQLSGFASQEERLDNGSVLSYKLVLNTKQRTEQGFDYIIEYIGAKDDIVRKQFVKGKYSVTEEPGAYTDMFPFYALDVLAKYLEEDDTDEIRQNKNVYKFSATFSRGRSFVTFSSGTKNISGKEKEAIEKYMDTYYEQSQAGIFVKKIEVEYNKQTFIAFVPEILLHSVKKNKTALISYAVFSYNNDMYLLLTDIKDLD